MAAQLKGLGSDKSLYLCDTFRGIPKAGVHDTLKGGEYADCSADGVRTLLASLGVTATILEGVFPDENGEQVTGPIAMCHIDVDVYQSGKDIVAWLEPRTAPGAIVVFDDFGFSGAPGIARLGNELKQHAGWLFMHNLNGHGVMVRL